MPREDEERRLSELVSEGEHEKLEFKRVLPRNFSETLSGMANTSGGNILIGVSDDGEILGWPATNKELSAIEDHAAGCEPPISIKVDRLAECVLVRVEESDSKPVACKTGCYTRKGATTRRMTAKELRDAALRYNPPQFDRRICDDFRFPEDMDFEKYGQWLNSAFPSRQFPPEELLPKLAAAEKNADSLLLRNAAAMMFAKEPHALFPNIDVTYLLFNGTQGTKIVKRADYASSPPQAIEDTIEQLSRHMNTAYLPAGPQRREAAEYPLEAVREALVNALVHRDWTMHGANVFLELHSDRLIVKSPGGLPAGVTVDTIADACVRRNELLADLMHRAGYVEKAGTGINKMIQECAAAGNPPLEFAATDGFVHVVFRPHPEAVRS